MAKTRAEVLTAYLGEIEEQRIPQLLEDLAPMEDGTLTLRGHNDGVWVDETPVHIERVKAAIETYRNIAARLRADIEHTE